MPIQLLGSTCYLGVNGLPHETGICQGTHTAYIDFKETKPLRCYVKFYPNESGNVGLLNEVMGYTLAHHLGILQPRRAAIVIVPRDKLSRAGFQLPDWMQQSNQTLFPAWCTEQLHGQSLKFLYKQDAYLQLFEDKSVNTHAAAIIAAFDQWTANSDRNTGNIVRLSPVAHAIIDHGKIFGDEYWPLKGLPTDIQNKVLMMAKRALSEREHRDFLNRVISHADNHAQALIKATPGLQHWLNEFQMPEKLANTAIAYLNNRKDPHGYANEIGILC